MCQPFALPDSKAFLLPLQRGANTNTLCIQRELLLVCVAQTLIAPIFFFFFFFPRGGWTLTRESQFPNRDNPRHHDESTES